jgi:hypothetical protein
MFVCCEYCVLSGRGLCDELITRPEESYRVWCVVVCDLENLKNEVTTRVGSQRHRKKKKYIYIHTYIHISRRSQWPRGLKRKSAATRLLKSWVRIPPGHRRLSVVSIVCCPVEVSATS